MRAAGIKVDVGLCGEIAARDHAGHIRRVRDGRPHVILKLAVSQDDRIAAAGHQRVDITGPRAQDRVHLLRAQCDAILIGIGTALADDPLLTCRLPGMAERSPRRIVLDSYLRLPTDGRLARSARQTEVSAMASAAAEAARAALLGAEGVQVIRTETNDGSLPLDAVLKELSRRGINRLMVEGGSRVAASFVSAGLVDEAWLLRGTATIGAGGVPALHDLPLAAITQSPQFRRRGEDMLGADQLTIYDRA